MAKRPHIAGTPGGVKQIRTKATSSLPATGPSRVDRLVEVIDHCTAAKDTADEIGEKFLSYLLAMAIQETRSAMRRTPNVRRD